MEFNYKDDINALGVDKDTVRRYERGVVLEEERRGDLGSLICSAKLPTQQWTKHTFLGPLHLYLSVCLQSHSFLGSSCCE